MIDGRRYRVVDAARSRAAGSRRYWVVHDTTGPKVRLGLAWFAAASVALALGWAAVAALYAVVAGWAALDVVVARRATGRPAGHAVVAAVGAAAVVVASAFGTGALGVAMLGLVAAAVVAGALRPHRRLGGPWAAAGATVVAALVPAAAAVGVVLTRRLEIGAAVTLLVLVSAWEVGDFLVGSAASSAVEGPVAGSLAVAVVAVLLGVVQAPPFHGFDVLAFAAVVIVACPLGQAAASAALSSVEVPARSLRRLDSMIVLGPAWAFVVGIYLQRAAG
ncbi:MAG: hypothetical protein HYX34_12400 [Actinobacteria bacterium]|nr:hypothetical protein [Actinomycetota bacterium]